MDDVQKHNICKTLFIAWFYYMATKMNKQNVKGHDFHCFGDLKQKHSKYFWWKAIKSKSTLFISNISVLLYI
jgi:hypothetical protein